MRPRRIARVARWEVSRSAGTVDRKTILVLVAMALLVGVVGVSVLGSGAGLEDGLYRVGVDADQSDGNPYVDVVESNPQFTLEETTYAEFAGGDSDADVFVDGSGRLGSDGTAKGDAAHTAFRDAIDRYNHDLMRVEVDEYAAYPVLVSIQYQQRSQTGASGSNSGSSAGAGSNAGDGSSGSTGGGSGSSDPSVSGDARTATGDGDGSGDSRLQIPDVGGGSLGESVDAGTPGAISPPFPFQSLVLAFLFVVPMNFVIQAYGSTIMDERIKRRGELLLVAPITSTEIVAGKTLPYLLGVLGIVAAITVAIEGGLLSVLAALPIALLFLAATFVGALLARSFKELTFVTVAISVFLTTYTFVPAIFTDVTPIALISPLTLIVMDLQGESATLGEYLFSTGAFYLGSLVLFVLGIGIYREEDLFTQKPIPAKVVDALASRIHGYRHVPLLSILFIPFVFAGQLLAVALLFALPAHLALPILFLVISVLEELAKSVHVYAGFARSRFEASLGTAVVVGTLAGAGFFVGEKFTHVVQFVGLPDLEIGLAAFGPALSTEPLVLAVLFFVPLVLHVVTAVISAIGASRGRTGYAIAFTVAVLVHTGYNLGVIGLVS
ncbi:PrsW family intramembrane metalloprotease [Halobacteria archaeon AArc-m2/3/4]|uniref:PrsW family intramembrane metalloprotease n=1 Tax=Natronoglomus mannanivorans TaxID=2979990 RepID=A0ABT2Q9G5_9EURY|nr:PrsW family intramembrane metalloprotease [Halobacteria archaeon AArc-m2/3/4]